MNRIKEGNNIFDPLFHSFSCVFMTPTHLYQTAKNEQALKRRNFKQNKLTIGFELNLCAGLVSQTLDGF